MPDPSNHLDEVGRMAGLLLEGALSREESLRLERLLMSDPAALDHYQDYVELHILLRWHYGLAENGDGDAGFKMQGAELPSGHRPEGLVAGSGAGSEVSGSPFSRAFTPQPFPIFHYQTSSASAFVGDVLFSYLTALVIVGVGLLAASVWKLPEQTRVAMSPVSSVSEHREWSPMQMQSVGQVTAMVNCRWADPSTETVRGASVLVGRRYALASGQMEITYDSGARVILQGPVTYEVNSVAGGLLSLGKLTARVESTKYGVRSTKTEKVIRSQRSMVGGSEVPSPEPRAPSPSSLSTTHYPLFTIETPTAVVTDLGTEFGVEVGEEGSSEVHVLVGAVDLMSRRTGRHVRLVAQANTDKPARAARVEATGSESRADPIVLIAPNADRFLRAMPKPDADRTAERVVVSSRFDLSSEGWTATEGSSRGLIYAHDAGNPGGCIQTQEGTGDQFFYFIASPKFSGNGLALFGGQLKFDVYTTIFHSTPDVPETMATEPPLVILQGRHDRIAADQTTPAVRDQWKTLTVPLSAAGKWYRLAETGGLEGKQTDRTPVSDDVLRAVLSDLREVWIRAEYMHGRDLGRLDNVQFLAPGENKPK